MTTIAETCAQATILRDADLEIRLHSTFVGRALMCRLPRRNQAQLVLLPDDPYGSHLMWLLARILDERARDPDNPDEDVYIPDDEPYDAAYLSQMLAELRACVLDWEGWS